jgi:hypothetical protein
MWPIYAEGPVDLPREVLIYGEVEMPYQSLSSLWPFASISGLTWTIRDRFLTIRSSQSTLDVARSTERLLAA